MAGITDGINHSVNAQYDQSSVTVSAIEAVSTVLQLCVNKTTKFCRIYLVYPEEANSFTTGYSSYVYELTFTPCNLNCLSTFDESSNTFYFCKKLV